MSQVKQLFRSRSNRMVAGECAGLGDFLGIDPTVVRLVFILAALFGYVGPLVITYLVLFIVVPEEPQPASSRANDRDGCTSCARPCVLRFG